MNEVMQKAFEMGGLEDGGYHLEADELEYLIHLALSKQAEPALVQDERDAFEAWMVEVEGVRIRSRFDRVTAGPFADEYRDGQIQGAWNVWQASAARRPAQTEQQPEQSGLSLPRTRLERIERRLTDWLELNCCECESGHSCGRNEVTADRDAIRAALSAQGESHE